MIKVHTCIIPFDWCPFCGKTIKSLKKANLDFKRIKHFFPRSKRFEIIELTNQKLVPVLEDQENIIFHSKEIINYINKQYLNLNN